MVCENNVKNKYLILLVEILFVFLGAFANRHSIPIVWVVSYYVMFRWGQKSTLKTLIPLGLTFGLTYFMTMFYFGLIQGFVFLLYVAVFFSLIVTITFILFRKLKTQDTIKDLILFVSIFWILKYLGLYNFFQMHYLLEIPVHFRGLQRFIPHSVDFHLSLFFLLSLCLAIEKKKFKSLSFLVLLGSSVYGINNFLESRDIKNKRTVKIALAQQFELRDYKKRESDTKKTVEVFEKMIFESIDRGGKVIVLPESIIVESDSFSLNLDRYVKISKDNDVVIVFGVNKIVNKKTYNSAIVIDPEKGLLPTYNAMTVYTDWAKLEDVVLGEEPYIFKTKYGNFFINICFELLDRYVQKKYFLRNNEVDYIISIANNLFFTKSRVMDYLILNQQYVASWFKKPLLSATNTGPTVVINDLGVVEKKIKRNEENILIHNLSY